MTVASGRVDQHDVVILESADIRVSVDVERGAHIFSIVCRETGTEVLFQDPRGLAGHVVGGWYELFPNAGPASGEPAVPQHGDVRSARWRVLRAQEVGDGGVLHVVTESAALPLTISRTMTLDGRRLRVDETIANLSDEPTPYLWGHHVTFGVEPGGETTIEVDSRDIVSLGAFAPGASIVRADAEGAGLDDLPHKDGGVADLTRFPMEPASEMLFARTIERARASVVGPRLRVDLSWDERVFPALWLWIENRGAHGEPFRGTTSGLALEPQAGYLPTLESAIRAGIAPILAPRGSVDAWIELEVRSASTCPEVGAGVTAP